jgi:hypothetical protein
MNTMQNQRKDKWWIGKDKEENTKWSTQHTIPNFPWGIKEQNENLTKEMNCKLCFLLQREPSFMLLLIPLPTQT